MSRSFKKNPFLKYAPKGKVGQKFANRRVRRYKGELPTKGYGFLKKIYDPWNVHDIVQRNTLQEYLVDCEKTIKECYHGLRSDWVLERYNDKEKNIQHWKKWYWRK